jgi:hypothetical protein
MTTTNEPPEFACDVLDAFRDEELQNKCHKSIQAEDGWFSDFELDLSDWSMAFGVAWAIARERKPQLSSGDLAMYAHEAAGWAFHVYCGKEPWTERWERDGAERGPVRGDPGTPEREWLEQKVVAVIAGEEN